MITDLKMKSSEELGQSARSTSAFGSFLAQSFLDATSDWESFLDLIAQFDRFFHVASMRRYTDEELPRFLFARHCTQQEIVFDYAEAEGTSALVKDTLIEIVHRNGYRAEIECRPVMTIQGRATRFLIQLT